MGGQLDSTVRHSESVKRFPASFSIRRNCWWFQTPVNHFIHRGCQKILLFDSGLKSFQNIGVSSRTLRKCLRVHLKCLLFLFRKLAAWPVKMGWASQKEGGLSPNYHSCQGFLLLVSGAGNCKLVNLARFLKHQEGTRITTTSCGPILPSYKCITLLDCQQ